MTEPRAIAKPSPELIRHLAETAGDPPMTATQKRHRDEHFRVLARRSAGRAERQRRRDYVAARGFDPASAAASNNYRRLAALERDYETGRRPDGPSEIVDHGDWEVSR